MAKQKQQKSGRADGKSKGKVKRKTLASQVDLLELYQNSVMAPEEDCAFFDELYLKLRGEKAEVLREDFCGTAKIATAWCEADEDRRAVGVDLDLPTLEWGRERNVTPSKAASRIIL